MIVLDSVKFEDLEISVNFDFGKEDLENRDDTGLVEVSFKIDGNQFEYNEWFDSESGKLETVDCMFPLCSSDKASAFYNYLDKLNYEEDRAWNALGELEDLVETSIKSKMIK